MVGSKHKNVYTKAFFAIFNIFYYVAVVFLNALLSKHKRIFYESFLIIQAFKKQIAQRKRMTNVCFNEAHMMDIDFTI